MERNINSKCIAVLLYLYDTELWHEYKQLLHSIKDYIFLDVALCDEDINQDNVRVLEDLQDNFAQSQYRVRLLPNRGVDVGPFLIQLSGIDAEKYPYFIKLHSKTSLWGIHQTINWRSFLVDCLIGSKDILSENITKINQDRVGMIGCKGLCLGVESNYYNDNIISFIMYKVLQLKKFFIRKNNQIYLKDHYIDKFNFIAGTMFMSKTAIFQKYFTKDIIPPLYDMLPNKKPTNVSLPHSLERIFGYIMGVEKKKIIDGSYTKNVFLKEGNVKHKINITYSNDFFIDQNSLLAGTVLEASDEFLVLKWLNDDNEITKKYAKHKRYNYYVA